MDNDDAVHAVLCAALAYVVYDNLKAMRGDNDDDHGHDVYAYGSSQRMCEQTDMHMPDLPRFQDAWAKWRRQWGIWPNDLGDSGQVYISDSGQSLRQQMM